MRTLALFLLLPAASLALLTPKDEADIRAAIKEEARTENLRGTREIWSERGPILYKVQTIEEVTPDVATAEAQGVRSGSFPEHRQYIFILTRSHGRWSVVKKFQSCRPPGIQLLSERPQ